jgi:hypothetical protein
MDVDLVLITTGSFFLYSICSIVRFVKWEADERNAHTHGTETRKGIS